MVNVEVIKKDAAKGKAWEEVANKYGLAQKGVSLFEYVIRCNSLAAGAKCAYNRWLAEIVLLTHLDEPEDLPGDDFQVFGTRYIDPPFSVTDLPHLTEPKLHMFLRYL